MRLTTPIVVVVLGFSSVATCSAGLIAASADLSISSNATGQSKTDSMQSANPGTTGLKAGPIQTVPIFPQLTGTAQMNLTVTEPQLFLPSALYHSGLSYSVSTDDFDDRTKTSVQASVPEGLNVALLANSPGAVLPNQSLVMHGMVSATITSQFSEFGRPTGDLLDLYVSSSQASGAALSVKVTGSDLPASGPSNNFAAQVTNFSQSFDLVVLDPLVASGLVSGTWSASFDYGGAQTYTADATHSFDVTSFTFADGTTPQQHGFDVALTLADVTSPSAPAPEPGSLLLCTIGAAGLLWRRAKGSSCTSGGRISIAEGSCGNESRKRPV